MIIELPAELRDEIAAANNSLNGTPDKGQFRSATQVAQRAIVFYQQRVPEVFADHVAEFYRARAMALEAGRHCDAYASILGWRNHAHAIETDAPTTENIAWLKNIFARVLGGQIHLRA